MIIDIHAHIEDPTALYFDSSAEGVIGLMDQCGIDMSVIGALQWLAGYPAQANVATAKAVEKYPNRFMGTVYVHPQGGIDKALEEAERYVRQLGFKAIGEIHPATEFTPANSERYYYPVMEKAIELKVPVHIHCGDPATDPFSGPMLIGDLAERFPEARIILGHLGHRRWYDAIWTVKNHDNLLVDTSFAQTSALVKAVQVLGAERVLFGTDTPVNNPAAMLSHVRGAYGLTEEQKSLILGKNAAKLLGLKER